MSFPVTVIFTDVDLNVVVNIDRDTRIIDVKHQIATESETISEYIAILYEGVEVNDNLLVIEIGIDSDSTFDAQINKRGRAMQELGEIEPTFEAMMHDIKSNGSLTMSFIDCDVFTHIVDENGSTPLLVSVWYGNLTAFNILLQISPAVNRCNHWGLTPLLMACQLNRTSMVSSLLAHPNIDINLETKTRYTAINSTSGTPLHVACKKGFVDIVKTLLADPRLDVNKKFRQATALQVACKANLVECVMALLQHPDITSGERELIQVAEKFGFLQIAEALRNHEKRRAAEIGTPGG